ncbi:MAG: hypothetical protein CMJ21_02755 [Phycisphaerae bacterium]|nr:hypothetical protein [Phycisphaerae bacterium]
MTDQASALRSMVRQESSLRRGRFVAVTSGKGGVGKTSVALNLSVFLSNMGRRVVLLDADLGTANVDVLCNLTPHANLAHVIAGRKTLAEATIEGPGGFQLIPGASGLASLAALSSFERQRLIDQMQHLDQSTDMILIDTGAGVGPNVLGFAVNADQVVVVTTPEPTAITDAYAVIKTIVRQRADADIAVLVNMVRSPYEARAVFARIETVCQRFLRVRPRLAGHVLSDPRVALAVRRRRPFVLDSPQCDATRCIGQLAHRLDRDAHEPKGVGLLRRMATWIAS